MFKGLGTTLKCMLGLWLGCLVTSSASAQVVMMSDNAFPASAISFGQPRVIGFQPATMGSQWVVSNRFAGTGISFAQPATTMAISGFSTVPLSTNRMSGFTGNTVIANPALPTGSVSGYGRIIRIRYRVPVYGKVQAVCPTACDSVSDDS